MFYFYLTFCLSPCIFILLTDCFQIHEFDTLSSEKNSQVKPIQVDEVLWKKLAEDRFLVPVDKGKSWIRYQELSRTYLQLKLCLLKDRIQLYLDSSLIYEKVNGITDDKEPSLGGIHVIVIHPTTGHVMSQKHIKTSQPGESRILSKTIARVLPGRLLILMCIPYGTSYLTKSTKRLLEDLGSERISRLAFNETWALIGHTRNSSLPGNSYKDFFQASDDFRVERTKIWFEGAFLTGFGRRGTPPSHVAIDIPRLPMPKCQWEEMASKRVLKEFCQTYDGYPEICRCDNPIDPKELRKSAPKGHFGEIIPVALLTALNAWNFYRQVINILSIAGSSETPIIVFTDGHNVEINHIAALFDLPVYIHEPQGWNGSYTRLNMHFRFSVYNIFNLNAGAKKAIILEDDLLLSPDFLLYFHQMAWLLEADPTIYCINAFAINSYPTVASDPTKLKRTDAMPQFGWLITKQWVMTQLPLWIAEKVEKADWDWWLGTNKVKKGRHVIVPEISRTFHAGSAGSHVTGWIQSLYFNNMIFNQEPNVTLSDISGLLNERYDIKLEEEIRGAKTLGQNFITCEDIRNMIKPPQKAYKISVFADTFNYYETTGFLIMALCLHAYTRDYRDIYKGVQEYRVNNCVLYIIGCPVSPFCSLLGNETMQINPDEDALVSAERSDYKWRSRDYPRSINFRRPPKSPEEEYTMMNFYTV